MSQHGAESTLRQRTAQRIEDFAAKQRAIYLILISLLALIGYGYLFLFPAGVVFGLGYLIDAFPRAATLNDWEKISAMFCVTLLCAVTCLHILRFRQPRPAGVRLEREQTPELFKLIDTLCKQYGHRRIRQVTLGDEFRVEIRKTPTLGFPLLFSSTLVIGLPLLQTVAPKHFRCELARRIGQDSRRGAHLSHHLFEARQLWDTYLTVLITQPRFGDQLLRWFFHAYTPLFALLSLPAARQDELAADATVLEFINDQDMFEAIKATAVCNLFLNVHYWPKVRTMALKEGGTELMPFAKLALLVGPALQKIDGKKWLANLADGSLDPESPLPAFRQRMRNIGHEKIRDLPRITATAAGLYLKDASFAVPAIDELWRTATLPTWAADYQKRREDIEAIRALSELSHQGKLSFTEIWRYARLAKTLKQTPRHRSILKLMRRNLTQGKALSSQLAAGSPERLNDVF